MSKFDYDIFYGGTDDLGVSKEKYTKEEAIKTVEERKPGHWEGAVCGHGNCENNTGKRRMRSVWNMATTASGGVTHYAKFPNELAERCILCGTAEGDVVLDPFVGSGTSCRVANRYGRQYIGD